MKKALVLLAALISAFVMSCGSTLPAPSKPSVSTGSAGEALTLSWDPVDGAVSYKIYFTTDGTAPAFSSPGFIEEGTTFDHTSLDAALDYRYAVSAVGTDGFSSPVSEASDPVKPNPICTLSATFATSAGEWIGCLLLDVPYDPVGDTITGSVTTVGTSQATNSTGTVVFPLVMDHTRHWGYAVFVDVDHSGTLTTGDTVMGSGGTGTYGYLYYKTLRTSSFSTTLNFGTAATHTF